MKGWAAYQCIELSVDIGLTRWLDPPFAPKLCETNQQMTFNTPDDSCFASCRQGLSLHWIDLLQDLELGSRLGVGPGRLLCPVLHPQILQPRLRLFC